MIEEQAPIAALTRDVEFGTLAALGATVAACGGGGGDSAPVPPLPPTGISAAQASRFLAQASMGATRAEIARVQALGYAGWLDEQFALPQQGTRWDWLVSKGFDAATNKNSEAGFDASAWRKLIASPDTLRQRVTLALSEIVVTAIDGLVGGGGWKAFCAAAWLDMLEANAFGNYRALLQDVSRSTAMGLFLTFRGNLKADAIKGTLPDENYAREVMQLFTIGLQKLNADGSLLLVGGQPQDTYGQDDIGGLARVFTGWDFDLAGGTTATPDYQRRPMIQVASRHESGAKSFLGTTIARRHRRRDQPRAGARCRFCAPERGAFRRSPTDPAPGDQQSEPGLRRARRGGLRQRRHGRQGQPARGVQGDPARRRSASVAGAPGRRQAARADAALPGLGPGLQRHLGQRCLGHRQHLRPRHAPGPKPVALAIGLQFLPPRLRAAEQRHRQRGPGRARVPDHQRIVGRGLCQLHATCGQHGHRRPGGRLRGRAGIGRRRASPAR